MRCVRRERKWKLKGLDAPMGNRAAACRRTSALLCVTVGPPGSPHSFDGQLVSDAHTIARG
jgi:hypothetical protein